MRSPKSRQQINKRKTYSNILIVCEGETEKIYFKTLNHRLRIPTLKIKIKSANGGSAVAILNTAHAQNNNDDFDKTYCIYDNDAEDITLLNSTLTQMRKNNYTPIYSNISFELWLYLHHKENKKIYTDPKALERDLKKIDSNYHKTRYNIEEYLDKIDSAINNSKLLCKDKTSINLTPNLTPYTNVYEIVEALKKEKEDAQR